MSSQPQKRRKVEKVIIISNNPAKINFSCNIQNKPTILKIIHKGISKSSSDFEIFFKNQAYKNYYHNIFLNQDQYEIFYGIACIIQTQITEEINNYNNRSVNFFDERFLEVEKENGGYIRGDEIPENILVQETSCVLSMRPLIISGVVPTIDTIRKFLLALYNKTLYPKECSIMALIYFHRVLFRQKISLTSENWRSIWVCAIIVSQKLHDDFPFKTSELRYIFPGITKKMLVDWEYRFINLLDYKTEIKTSLFTKYVTELRNVFTELVGTKAALEKRDLYFQKIAFEITKQNMKVKFIDDSLVGLKKYTPQREEINKYFMGFRLLQNKSKKRISR